ncbi:hypothetical protein L1887_00606 [Cichorium endivia]|nr:hypothetical protein L1887_00606 [Cichorium endivia]
MDRIVSVQACPGDEARLEIMGSRLKRRRIEKMYSKSNTPLEIGTLSRSINVELSELRMLIIDIFESTDMSSQSREIEATVEVGSAVGFQIEPGSGILLEIMGEKGENNRIQ